MAEARFHRTAWFSSDIALWRCEFSISKEGKDSLEEQMLFASCKILRCNAEERDKIAKRENYRSSVPDVTLLVLENAHTCARAPGTQ